MFPDRDNLATAIAEPANNGTAAPSRNGHAAPNKPPSFPAPIPCSQLRAVAAHEAWLWHGYIAEKSVTLLSALWKAGKTTLLAYLLRAMETGEMFCGRSVLTCKVLVVS